MLFRRPYFLALFLLMTAAAFVPGMDEGPDREVDYDMEEDYREMI